MLLSILNIQADEAEAGVGKITRQSGKIEPTGGVEAAVACFSFSLAAEYFLFYPVGRLYRLYRLRRIEASCCQPDA